jgi:transglutaminase-like putative cysteine protease
MGLLALALVAVPWSQPLGALAIGLGVLTALKLVEARSVRERRLVGLLQLFSAGLLASLQADLAGSLLQGLAALLALAGLLALELGEGLGWQVMLRRSAQLVLAALPMALVLFLLLPRLGPFTVIEGGRGVGAITGLSDSLDPAGIAELATSQAPAARVAFPQGDPPPAGDRYWRVLVHGQFDGRRWSAAEPRRSPRPPLPPAAPALPSAPPAGTGAGTSADAMAGSPQLWLVEPSGLPPVPWSGRGRPQNPDLRIDPLGQLRHRGSSGLRRVYTVRDDGRPAAWASRPPDLFDQQLPLGTNPRLEALGRQWGTLATPEQRLAAAERWFRSQPFRYTLRPGTLPGRAPLDTFLFERQEGFCGHYASAFTALMRAAGVPARVVSGYRGGDWVVPLGGSGYIDIRQGNAHAWSEVWLPGQGWRPVDPTSWVPAPLEERGGASTGALRWVEHQWWGLDLAWTRLWLSYDPQGQEALLQRLLGERRQWLGALVLVGLTAGLALAVAVLAALQRRTMAQDPWRRELDRTLAALARRGLTPQPGETLPRFAARVEERWPALAPDLAALVDLYQRHRFAPDAPKGRRGGQRELRRQLRQHRRRLGRQLQRQPE